MTTTTPKAQTTFTRDTKAKTVTFQLPKSTRRTTQTLIAYDALGIERWFDDRHIVKKVVSKTGIWTITISEDNASYKAWRKSMEKAGIA